MLNVDDDEDNIDVSSNGIEHAKKSEKSKAQKLFKSRKLSKSQKLTKSRKNYQKM